MRSTGRVLNENKGIELLHARLPSLDLDTGSVKITRAFLTVNNRPDLYEYNLASST